MIKVLQVTGSLKTGGLEKVVLTWMKELDKNKYQVDFVVYGNEIDEFEKYAKTYIGNVYHLNTPVKGYFRYKKQLKKLIVQEEYDVIHCHTMFSSAISLWLAKKCGVGKRVVHSHSSQNKINESIIDKIYGFFMRLIIKACATDFLACDQSAGEFLYGEVFFNSHGVIFPNSVDAKLFEFDKLKREKIRAEYNIKESQFVIGALSRLHPVKNHLFSIKVFNEILKERNDAVMMIVGEGEDKSKLNKLSKELGISNAIIYTGMQKNTDEFYSCFDIMIMPSLFEGFPISLLEAQASGVFIAASDAISESCKLCDNLKLYSLQKSEQEWAKCILNEYKLSERCNAISNTPYDISITVSSLRKLYGEIYE